MIKKYRDCRKNTYFEIIYPGASVFLYPQCSFFNRFKGNTQEIFVFNVYKFKTVSTENVILAKGIEKVIRNHIKVLILLNLGPNNHDQLNVQMRRIILFNVYNILFQFNRVDIYSVKNPFWRCAIDGLSEFRRTQIILLHD